MDRAPVMGYRSTIGACSRRGVRDGERSGCVAGMPCENCEMRSWEAMVHNVSKARSAKIQRTSEPVTMRREEIIKQQHHEARKAKHYSSEISIVGFWA